MSDLDEHKLIVSIKVTGDVMKDTDQHQAIIALVTDALETDLNCKLLNVEIKAGVGYDQREKAFRVDDSLHLYIILINTAPFLVSYDNLSMAVELALMSYSSLRSSILSFHTDLSRQAEDIARRRAR